MLQNQKINYAALGGSIALSMGAGAVAGLFTGNAKTVYAMLELPSFAPPAAVFPWVWSVLYLLMGVSSYLIYVTDTNTSSSYGYYNVGKKNALIIYGLQLFFNVLWPLLFFMAHYYLGAFVCITILWYLLMPMLYMFTKINRWAGILQIPYFLWVSFAGYLNWLIYKMN